MNWDQQRDKNAIQPQEPLVSLENAFTDDRGCIQPLVEAVMHSALLIYSKGGTVRGNHYHRTDWHYCYIVSGTMEYYYRPTGSKEPPERVIVKAGQMVFTPPMIDHAMKFPEDTVFLTLSRNARNQEAYEVDLVRIEMI